MIAIETGPPSVAWTTLGLSAEEASGLRRSAALLRETIEAIGL